MQTAAMVTMTNLFSNNSWQLQLKRDCLLTGDVNIQNHKEALPTSLYWVFAHRGLQGHDDSLPEVLVFSN